ncbi:MAG: hypothetical protein V7709_15275 [Halioglobus sp.]
MTTKLQISHWNIFSRFWGFRVFLLAIFLFLAPFATQGLQAQQSEDKTRDVEVRLFLIDIQKVDTVAQSFIANLTMVLRWQDLGLAHSGPASVSVSLDEIWHPKIQIINQQKIESTLPRMAQVKPDGEVVYRQRFWGSFAQPLDLQEFPFDSQSLGVSIANIGYGERNVNLIASPASGISETLTIPDWTVTGWNLVSEDFSMADETAGIGGMIFSIEVDRDRAYFKYKAILPLVLIVVMSWMVFWIDPSLAGSQISVSVTAMLTMIAYRFALAGMLPRLAFLTRLDYFVVVSTLAVFIVMIEVTYTAYLSTNGQIEKARRIDRRARWIAPLIYFPIAAEIFLFKFWT